MTYEAGGQDWLRPQLRSLRQPYPVPTVKSSSASFLAVTLIAPGLATASETALIATLRTGTTGLVAAGLVRATRPRATHAGRLPTAFPSIIAAKGYGQKLLRSRPAQAGVVVKRARFQQHSGQSNGNVANYSNHCN